MAQVGKHQEQVQKQRGGTTLVQGVQLLLGEGTRGCEGDQLG